MEGARFKILPVFGSLLLLSWSLTCVHGEALNTHELIFNIFELAEKDVRYLDKLVEIHTKNGVFDKEGYDNAMKQRNPLLHAKMENFRKIYREVEKENSEAVGFIDTIFRTARSVRGSVITTAKEMRLIQSRFDLLSNSAQQYLMKKFPPLKFLGESSPGQKFTGTTTRVIETSTSPPETTTSGTVTSNQGSHSSSTISTQGTVTGNQGSHSTLSTTPSNHNKPFNGSVPKDAAANLKLAEANLQKLSLPYYFKNAIKRINRLLTKEPKDWSEKNFEEVLRWFKSGLSDWLKKLSTPQPQNLPEFGNKDVFIAQRFLDRLCHAFTHKVSCNTSAINTRINEALQSSDTKEKLKILVDIIQSQIDGLEFAS